MGMIEPALLLCMILGKRLGARGASASDNSQLSFGTLVKDFLVRRARLLQTCRCETLLAEAKDPSHLDTDQGACSGGELKSDKQGIGSESPLPMQRASRLRPTSQFLRL